jgi:transcriptional regulator with XRE-family HTH domain
VSNHYTWADYLRALHLSQADLAAKGGVSQPTVSRWLKGEVTPDAKQVIAVARAAQHSPIGALIAAGYLEEEEIGGGVEIPTDLHLRLYTDRSLLQEVIRRIDSGERHDDFERPLDSTHPALQDDEPADVGADSEDELRQRGLDLAANRDQSADRLDPDTQ